MDLSQLKKEIPFKWRVQSFSKHKPQAACVAYLDSRQVQELLDEVVGPENWQDKYEEHKNNLFCSIGIKTESGWVWKTDCGTESNVDKEKGEASDAFKRAAVKWGVGRFLYAMPLKYLPANAKKEQSNYPYVVDQNGKQVWDLTEHINRMQGRKPAPQQASIPVEMMAIKKELAAIKPQLTEGEINSFRAEFEKKNWPVCKQIHQSIINRLRSEVLPEQGAA